ncbi:hypothetical protein C3L33_17469, partial [Rhododendron williamsianum]
MAEANNDSGLGQEEKQKKGKSPVVENDHSYPIADGVGNDHCSIGSSDDYSYPIADGVGNKQCSIGLPDDYSSYPIADGVGNEHCSIGSSDDGAAEDSDPLVLFGSDIMMKILKNLDARSVALSLLVSRGWYGVASSDRLWTAKLGYDADCHFELVWAN